MTGSTRFRLSSSVFGCVIISNVNEDTLYKILKEHFKGFLVQSEVRLQPDIYYCIESFTIDISNYIDEFPDGLPENIREIYFEPREDNTYRVTRKP